MARSPDTARRSDHARPAPTRPAARTSLAPGTAHVALVGEHDLSTRDELRSSLAPTRGRDLIIDLSACEFIDVTAAAVIASARAEATERGDQVALLIPAEHAPMARLIRLTGLADFVPAFEELAQALAYFGRTAAPNTTCAGAR